MPLSAAAPPFALRTDFLYMAPSYDETYFVVKGNRDGVPNGLRCNNQVGYNFGFRLEGIFPICQSCFDFRIRWTHLYATSRRSVTDNALPAQLWPVEIVPSANNVSQPFAGSASSDIGVMHQRLECLLNEQIWQPSCFRLFLREGIGWHYIRYHEVIEYKEFAGQSEKIQFHAHTKGIGPELALTAFCEPWRALSLWPEDLALKLMGEACLIAANSKAKIAILDTTALVSHVTQSSFWKVVPEFTIGVGIKYFSQIWRCPTHFELGYELTSYPRGTSKLLFISGGNPGLSFNQYSDFFIRGFYFGLTCFF